MTLELAEPTVVALLLGSIRVAAWLLIAPGLGAKWIPAPVRALLSVALVLPVLPALAEHAPPPTTAALVSAALVQVAVGAAMGFLTYIVFMAVQSAGDLIDISSGYSLASAFDPMSFQQNSVFGRLHQMIAMVLLFVLNLHLVLLRGVLTSFEALPLDAGPTSLPWDSLGALLTDGIGRMFLAAVEIAGPLIAVLFLADVGLALLTRVAPSLNAFSIGFPVKMLVALLLVGMTFPMLPSVLDNLVGTGNKAVAAFLGLT
ncbi:MAG TPA: flagellar biosynthetic protein FliR [Actinomycetes bacterium]|nr:flagellar biosynthetic protein FliR [Actinomycetes bacterium]